MSKNTNLSFLTDYITADITNGRIGINTPSPTVAFDVTGVAKFSSSVNIGTAGTETLNIFGAGSQYINIKNTTTSADMFVGMSSALAAAFIGTGSSNPIVFSTAGTERMRITAAGNVGIGTSSPSTNTNQTSLTINGALVSRVDMQVGGTRNAGFVVATDAAYLETTAAIPLVFYTNSVERMRITSGGQVCIGTTTAGVQNTPICLVNSTQTARIWSTGPNTSGDYVVYNNSGGGISGVYIGYGATSWTSNSDERLKNITGNIDNALNDLMTLRTIKHTWKLSDNNKEYLALIAQDVQKVFPQVVDIQDNEIKTLGVRYTELIPVLVKAIQELSTEINLLKQK